MPSETRFRLVVSRADTIAVAAADSPSPQHVKELAKAVKKLAELCGQQQTELDGLRKRQLADEQRPR